MSGTDPTTVAKLIAELNLDEDTAEKVMSACLARRKTDDNEKQQNPRPRGHGAPAQPRVTIPDL